MPLDSEDLASHAVLSEARSTLVYIMGLKGPKNNDIKIALPDQLHQIITKEDLRISSSILFHPYASLSSIEEPLPRDCTMSWLAIFSITPILLPSHLIHVNALPQAPLPEDTSCQPPLEATTNAPLDLSTGAPLRLCLDSDPDHNFLLTITCTPNTPVPGEALRSAFEAIENTAKQLIQDAYVTDDDVLGKDPGLQKHLHQGSGFFCLVKPDAETSPHYDYPSLNDTNPQGACVAMADAEGVEGGDRMTVKEVKQVATTLETLGQLRAGGINECHYALSRNGGGPEFAGGCWGKYDKALHLDPVTGDRKFECPYGT